jgi:hypothetical protein
LFVRSPGCGIVGEIVHASLLVALLSAGITVGTLRIPERTVGGPESPSEIIAGIGSPSAPLAVAKAQRAQARHLAAKFGPFTLPALPILCHPIVGSVLIAVTLSRPSGRAASRTRGARAPPASLPVS